MGLAEEPWAPQRSPETRTAELAPTLSRFAHLGARVQTQPDASDRSPDRSPEPLAPGRISGANAQEKKVSFWRRMALPRSPASDALPASPVQELLERMHTLQVQWETQQGRTDERLARSEDALRQILDRDREASLDALRQRLAGLEVDQTEAEEALRRATLGLKLLAGLLLLTAASGIGAVLLLAR
jgi:hypothetical protein